MRKSSEHSIGDKGKPVVVKGVVVVISQVVKKVAVFVVAFQSFYVSY